jgi:hypothetical protein
MGQLRVCPVSVPRCNLLQNRDLGAMTAWHLAIGEVKTSETAFEKTTLDCTARLGISDQR